MTVVVVAVVVGLRLVVAADYSCQAKLVVSDMTLNGDVLLAIVVCGNVERMAEGRQLWRSKQHCSRLGVVLYIETL